MVKFNEKETIYSRGDDADSFYVILAGDITIYSIHYNTITEDEYKVATLKLHCLDYFGDLELLYRLPRMQTAIANRDTYCLKYSKCHYNVHLAP